MLEFLLIELTQVFNTMLIIAMRHTKIHKVLSFFKNKFHTKKARPIKVFGLFCLYVYKFIHKLRVFLLKFSFAHVKV